MGLVKEFKEFAMKGNVVDMAVGIIIGGAFGKVVSSLVNDVLMPPIGKAIAGVNFAELKVSLGKTVETVEKDGETVETFKEAFINYGAFIQSIIDFLIIAAAIFVGIKAMNSLKSTKDEEGPAEPPEDILLLREIRDSLANK